MEKQKKVIARQPLTRVVSAEGDLKKPGVFLLYKGSMGPPSYVGRADSSLFEHLIGFRNHKAYKLFKIMPTMNKTEAYHMHCMLWHSGADVLDNGPKAGSSHPIPPFGVDSPCNYPGCDFSYTHPADDGVSYGSGGVSF